MDGAAGSGSERPSYFTSTEISGLDPRLVERLEHARGFAKIPFYITSGYRSPAQNKAVDGVFDSAHTRGRAVDLACFDSRSRMRMVSSLIIAGFRRIGIYSRHIHVDDDESLVQDVLWFGGESH